MHGDIDSHIEDAMLELRWIMLCVVLTGCTNGPDRANDLANSTDQVSPAATDTIGNSVMPDVDTITLRYFDQAPVRPDEPAPTYHMVAISGKLIAQQGCLVLDTGERKFALVFRRGSAEYDIASRSIVIDSQTYALGSSVMLGGSGGPGVQSTPDASLASECGADDIWLVAPRSIRLQ